MFVDATEVACKLTKDCELPKDPTSKPFGGLFYKLASDQGQQPRLAKPDLLVDNSSTSGQPPPPKQPDFLYASKKSGNSNRPVETVIPLSVALRIEINKQYASKDPAMVAADILTNCAGKVVLVCWHHSTIPDLANELMKHYPDNNGKDKTNLTWPDDVFDQIWQITYTYNNANKVWVATRQVLSQMLLYGDKDYSLNPWSDKG